MKNLIFLFALIFGSLINVNSQNNPLINSPAISPNGEIIAFNYQGDIWTVHKNGENLKRLTIHEAYDSNPIWSKDGKTIGFNSDRFGNNDIYTIASEGGIPKRITYHSTADEITDFTADNEIIFNTARNFRQVEREAEIHIVSSKGGTPTRFMSTTGFDAKLSPNKEFIVLTKGYCRIDREAYVGPANRNIWIYNIKEDIYTQLTTFEGQDYAPQWKNDNTILFQSARSGVYNIHELKIDTEGNKIGEINQISKLSSMGVYSFDLSLNGIDIVSVSGDQLSIIHADTKKSTTLNLTINSDYRFDPKERKTYSSSATEIEVSPNGELSAFVVRGEVFITENDTKKDKTINVSNSPYRDFDIIWLNDETLLFQSDRSGIKNLYSVTSNDDTNENIFTSLKHKITQITKSKEGITNPKLAPNNNNITYIDGTKLISASISETAKISKPITLVNNWDTPSGVSWSPDSKWLAYSLSDLYFNNEIYIHKADNSQKPVNISMHPKGDRGPVWSKDGKKIGFSSNRNNGDYDVWFVWLNREDWEKTKEDWEEEPEIKSDKKDKKNDSIAKTKDIIIDFEDIYERQVQVTSYVGGEFLNNISKDGKTFYYTTGNASRGDAKIESDLFKINWNGKDRKQLTQGSFGPRNLSFNSKETHLYLIGKGKLNRIKLTDSKKETLPFSAKMIVDYKEESNQIFDEAWNVILNRFYDPNHHGQDWSTLKNNYKPLALKASTRTDFKMIFNKMLGQINASHMGMYRGEDRKSVQSDRTGILGVEFESEKNGALKVSYIVPHSASNRVSSSLKVGDIIKSINGESLTSNQNVYELLSATANEKIILGINSEGIESELVIRPKSSARTDNYNAWVKERKRLTNVYSDGKLGYIHIQGMNWTSFERFERELTAAGLGKEGVVIDVRYNGGGWTTDYLMAVLNVKQHAYTVPRGATKNLEKENKNFKNYYPYSERLPLAALDKPSIALCNETSYSNAEIFSHAYKELGLGKLVGIPTFGAVISTGGQTLIDGSYVRVPFRGWYVKSSEKNMDFTPAMPDIVIANNPDDKAKGQDTQLKRAVDELLKDIN